MGRTLNYDTSAIFIGPVDSGVTYNSGDIKQFNRVQSSSFDIQIDRSIVPSLGFLDAHETVIESPKVNLNFEFLSYDGYNENILGIITDGEIGSFSKLNAQERDYFILTNKDEDAKVFAIGNGVVTSYAFGCEVGSPLSTAVTVEGYNINLDTSTSGNIVPRVDYKNGDSNPNLTYELPEYHEGISIRDTGKLESPIVAVASDIRLRFIDSSPFALSLSGDSVHVQNFGVAASLERNRANKMNYKYPIKRDIATPINLEFRASFILDDFTEDQIKLFECQEKFDVEIEVKTRCKKYTNINWDNEEFTSMKYTLRGLRLDNQSFDLGINSRFNIEAVWSTRIGNTKSYNKNIFISGNFGEITNQFKRLNKIDASSENNNFPNFNKEYVYDLVKKDSEVKKFNIEFVDNLNLDQDDLNPEFIYDGNTGIINKSGILNEDLIKYQIPWSVSTSQSNINLNNKENYINTWSGFYAPYYTGWGSSATKVEKEYYFYIESLSNSDEEVTIEIDSLAENLSGSIENPVFTLNPNKSLYINKLSLSYEKQKTPCLTNIPFILKARSKSFSREYLIPLSTPETYHISLQEPFSNHFHTWYDCYDRNTYQVTGLPKLEYDDEFYMWHYLHSKNTQGDKKVLRNVDLSNKSYLLSNSLGGFTTTVYRSDNSQYQVRNSGTFNEDFSNFSIFALLKVSNNEDKEQFPLWIGESYDNIGRGLYLSKSGENAIIGISGDSKVISGFTFDEKWHQYSLVYDGTGINIRIDGNQVDYYNLPISGYFNRISGEGFSIFKDSKGQLAEYLISSSGFNGQDVEHVEEYLSYKWGQGYSQVSNIPLVEYPLENDEAYVCHINSGDNIYGMSGIISYCIGDTLLWT